MDPDLPMHLWDRLFTQAAMMKNLLPTSRHPQMAAAAHQYVPLNYNKAEFALPGCKIFAHEKPQTWRTWEPHSKHVYSVAPAVHHYRFQNVYITSIDSERIVDPLDPPPLTITRCCSYYQLTDFLWQHNT
jgi:hypothetical protein